MRTNNSLKNIYIGVISQLVIVLLGFISRKVFLDSLGVEYLGVNGLFTNVLSMLALVESGIGTSIVYFLYKPLAINDKPKIIALIQLYKKAYKIIALLVLLLSLALYPFLDTLIRDGGSLSNVTIIYFIFIAKNMTYYLNAHKVTLINADQKGYILARVNLLFQVSTTVAKIIILLLTKNYILYLLIELLLFIVQTLYNGRIVEKKYDYIKTKEKFNITKTEKDQLIINIRALFLHNIGTYFVFGTDNLLISSFIGIATVGLYSNYTMIIGQLGALVSPLLGGVGASIGNLIAIEENEKRYSIFKILYLMNFWIYSFCVIFLYVLLEPFLNWWLGEGYLLDPLTFIIILVNFYLGGLRSSILTFKVKGGIFDQDKYIPLFEAAINLVASLILVKYLGLAGIFLGTTLSTLFVFFNAPYLVYKYIFDLPVWSYFKSYLLYGALTIITLLITLILCNTLVEGNRFSDLIFKGIICLVIPNIVYTTVFYNSNEFKYIKNILLSRILKTKIKISNTG
jgi:O-antigen/teichoic acid export membrane protein